MHSHWSNTAVTSQILIGYVLSDARFDRLVGNVRVYQEICFNEEVKNLHFPSFVELSFRGSWLLFVDCHGSWIIHYA